MHQLNLCVCHRIQFLFYRLLDSYIKLEPKTPTFRIIDTILMREVLFIKELIHLII